MILFVQHFILPVAGPALLWLARRWVLKKWHEGGKP